jgi:uncharacterized protein YlbG (UPF0298 family)
VIGKKSILLYFIAGIIIIIGIIWLVYFICLKDRAEFKETGSVIYNLKKGKYTILSKKYNNLEEVNIQLRDVENDNFINLRDSTEKLSDRSTVLPIYDFDIDKKGSYELIIEFLKQDINNEKPYVFYIEKPKFKFIMVFVYGVLFYVPSLMIILITAINRSLYKMYKKMNSNFFRM